MNGTLNPSMPNLFSMFMIPTATIINPTINVTTPFGSSSPSKNASMIIYKPPAAIRYSAMLPIIPVSAPGRKLGITPRFANKGMPPRARRIIPTMRLGMLLSASNPNICNHLVFNESRRLFKGFYAL